jgi:chromosome segregation ATPase
MEQLMALGIEIGDLDSTAKSLAALKTELAEEKVARVKAEVEAETLARAVEDLKKMTDRFAAQIPDLEERIKHLDNKVLNGLTELRTKELNLERTTKVNEDYKSQNSRLIKKLESKSPISFATWV